MQKTYNFGTHWVTTSEELTGYIEVFDVTEDEVVLIEEGANLVSVDGVLTVDESTIN